MPFQYIIGIIVILYGIRFATKGVGVKSTPRLMVGAAMVLVGIAQFFAHARAVAIALSTAGVVVMVVALILMRGQIRRGRRPGR